MKKIVVFAMLIFALSAFALDLSLFNSFVYMEDGVTLHAEEDFGFRIRQYTEYSNLQSFSGATEEEMLAVVEHYESPYEYYFNWEGQNTGANVYNPDNGFYQIGMGTVVDNLPNWGQTLDNQYNPALGGFLCTKHFVIEIHYVGSNNSEYVEYLEYAGPNYYYNQQDTPRYFGTPPSDPGTGSGGSTGGATAEVDVTPIDIDGETIDPDVDVDPANPIDITVDITVLPDATQPGAPNTDISYGIEITGAIAGEELEVTLSYDGYSATPQFIYWWNGTGWEVPTTVSWDYPGNTVTITFTMPNTRDGSTEVILGDQDPLPVTLTNFMAQYLDNEFVRVNWTAESESHMYGYRLYRSQSDLSHVEYTSDLINATNSPETQVYTFEDYEVTVNETYFYWVEALDLDGASTMHGPISITIEEEEVPELPTETVLIGNYPNPFNPVTNIKFDVKEGETAELSIYNAKGQIVVREEFEATPGGYTYSWDASKNSSGIYFYRLSSPSYNSVKKMIMLK